MPSDSIPTSRPRGRRALLFALAGVLAIAAVAFLAFASTGALGDNVHVVVPGKLYRCAQVSTVRLDALIDEHGIRCVLSLRKDDPPAPEFAAEIEHLRARGMPHENVPLSPTRLPKPEALAALLARFDAGPYPLLVHCEEGADRTGLAVVLWLVVHEGRKLEEALASDLSWKTGHIPLGQARAMDEFFALFQRSNRGETLRDWITSTYPGLYRGRTGAPADPGAVHAQAR